jgi:hypothetical protein
MKLILNKNTGLLEIVNDTTAKVFLKPISEASFGQRLNEIEVNGIKIATCYIPKNRIDINEWFSKLTISD